MPRYYFWGVGPAPEGRKLCTAAKKIGQARGLMNVASLGRQPLPSEWWGVAADADTLEQAGRLAARFYADGYCEAPHRGRPSLPDDMRKPREALSTGNPLVRARVKPEIAEWLKSQGGADYLRALLEREFAAQK